jgi:SAM-dependent methyltransferase
VSLPLPPRRLAARVGTPEGADPVRFYLDEGARLRALIDDLVPAGWSWDGKRVLDFGCGSARVLRHFADVAPGGDFRGCDIDPESIAWDREALSPPLRFFTNGLEPPLDLPGGALDLVYAMSVFTHIGDGWAAWLAELHRVLAPGGLLIASFLGAGMWEAMVEEPYREDEVGMTVLQHWTGPDAAVFHSEWWLREHWGRAFDVLEVRRPPADAITHSYVVLRRREVAVGIAELERLDPGERREPAALATSLRLARRESARLAAAGPPGVRELLSRTRAGRAARRALAPRRRSATGGRP